LAKTPTEPPRHKVEIQRVNGRRMQVADPKATRAMVALMDMQAQLNGAASHWGGPSAFAELMSATHALMFDEARQFEKNWSDLFHFVNDAGHCENGLYALKANYKWADVNLETLKDFRSIEGFLTGHGEAHLFPQGVYISNGPLGSGLPQAQGLALAEGLKKSNRVTICAISDGGCMEGEAREALAAIPGFAQRGRLAPFLMIISDNNTKLSGRIDEDSFSMNPTFASLRDLGWKVIQLADGHNLEAAVTVIDEALQSVKANPRLPIAIHAKTIKGYGVEKTMKASTGGHGFPLKAANELKAFLQEIYAIDQVPQEFLNWCEALEQGQGIIKVPADKDLQRLTDNVPSEKVQVGVAKALIAKRDAGYPVISVSADLQGSTGVADFQKKFPEATIDVGVAEANMVSVAIGLSKEGFIPVVDTFSQFGVTKGNLPLIMSALSHGPVIGIFSHVGFQDAADGASHQALSYFAATAAIPHTDCYALSSSAEAEALVGQAVEEFKTMRAQGKIPRSKLFFLGRENFPRRFAPEGAKYELGKAQVICDWLNNGEKRVLIAAAGAMLGEALVAADQIKAKGFGVAVVNPSVINHPDVATIATALKRANGCLITAEDHQVMGGMGAQLVHALLREGHEVKKLKTLGVHDQFGQSAYQAADLYQKHGIDRTAIVKAAIEILA
jgi:transketolase